MITVMLVDDEYMAREDIKSLFCFEAHGFQIVAEADNGLRGLEQFQKHRPQVVITDIEMPVLNGLDMALRIAEQAPQVKFILLTAYSEFDYARKAILLGASSYILKHEVDENSLLRELGKLREELSREREQQVQERTNALRSLIFVEQPEEYSPAAEPLLVPDRSLLLLLQLPRRELQDRERGKREELVQTVRNVLKGESGASFFYTTKSQYALVLTIPAWNSDQGLRGWLDNLVLTLRAQVRRILQADCEVALSRVWKAGFSCRAWYDETKNMFLERLLHNGRLYYDASRAKHIADAARHGYSAVLQRICTDMEKGEPQNLQALFRELAVIIDKSGDLQLFSQALDTIQLSLERIQDIQNQLDEHTQERESLKSETSYDRVIQRVTGAVAAFGQKAVTPYTPRVQRAIAYIRENYNKEITLGKIAAVMDVSEIYASQYFKKETGLSYMEYLTRHRIAVAKKLIKQEYKIYEVSEMVGYQTVQYFSRIFKRLTGLTPKEYYGADL